MSLQKLTDIIAALGAKYIINDTCKSLNITFPEDFVVIITSRRAIKTYDEENPERIDAILGRADSKRLMPIVNNRECNLAVAVKRWLTMDDKEAMGDVVCGVCYKTPTKSCPMTISICHVCGFKMCVKCLGKVQPDEDEPYQCPQCRDWLLYGHKYGTPHQDVYIEIDEEQDVFNQLAQVVSQLDGMTQFLVRFDNQFIPHPLSVLKYTKCDRYQCDDDHCSISQFKKYIKMIYEKCMKNDPKAIFKIYTIRDTYKIDKAANRPITEMSVFEIFGGKLFQYSKDAWINVFEMKNREIYKIEYVQPFKPETPDHIQALSVELNTKYQHEKTISVFTTAKCDRERRFCGFNFDVDANGKMTTMNVDCANMCMRYMLAKYGDDVYVACRVFSYDDINNADLVTYKINKDSYTVVDPKTSRELFNCDYDNLKRTKRIKSFL